MSDWNRIEYIRSMQGMLSNMEDKDEDYLSRSNIKHLMSAMSSLSSFRSEIEQSQANEYWKDKKASSIKKTKIAGGSGMLSEETSDVLEGVVIQNIGLPSSRIFEIVKRNEWLYERLLQETNGDEQLIIRYIDENIDMYSRTISSQVSTSIDRLIEAKKKS